VSSLEQYPFNRLAFKATHNSYTYKQGLAEQLSFSSKDPAHCGCCGIELDIVQTVDRSEWEVRHSGGSRPSTGDARRRKDGTRYLSDWLHDLLVWSQAENKSKAHNPITVILDLKEVRSPSNEFPDALHHYLIKCGFTPDCLFTPSDLLGRSRPATNLVEAASLDGGWPSLEELRGQFILVLSGSPDQKRSYARREDAFCFADRWLPRDLRSSPDLSRDGRIFVNIACEGRYGQRLSWACEHPALFVRVYNVNSERDWQEVLKGGANMLATDLLTGTSWARVCTDDEPSEWRLIECE
jgi:hypothetical protein